MLSRSLKIGTTTERAGRRCSSNAQGYGWRVDEQHRALLVAEEREAQRHAHAMYVDDRSVLNKWEEGVLERILDWLGDVDTLVLDVGCGVGHLGRIAAASGRRLDLVGFDLMQSSLPMHESAIGRWSKATSTVCR